MGTDIYGVLQVRYSTETPEIWTSEYPIEDGRNYYLFAALANVRNGGGIEPIAACRGLPDDFQPREWAATPRIDQKLADGWLHSVSWLTLQELNDWPGWDQVVPAYDDEPGGPRPLRDHCIVFLAWLNYANLATNGKPARIVFGFD